MHKFHIIGFFIVISLIGISCSRNESTASNDRVIDSLRKDFQLDSLSSNYNQLYETIKTPNGLLLMVMNVFTNGIDIYSVGENKLVRRVIIPREGPGSISSIDGFHAFSEDSIIIFSERSIDGLFYVRGEPQKKISSYFELDRKTIYNHHIASALPVLEFDGKLFIYSLPFANNHKISSFQELDFILDFNTRKVERVLSTKMLEETQAWGALGFPVRCLNPDNGSIVYSYPFTDQLMVYHINGKKFSEQSFKTSFFEASIKPGKGLLSGDSYLLENNYYDAIAYNSYNKLYYRFVRQFINIKNDNGTKNTVFDQPGVLMIGGSDFKLLKEVEIKPTHNFLIKDFFLTPEGLMISNANPLNPNLQEDIMSFYTIN